MTGLLIIVAVTALVGLILRQLDRRSHHSEKSVAEEKDSVVENSEEKAEEEAPTGECCGMHIVCEKDSLVPLSDKIEYYDDEELDRFSGREADAYDEKEIEEWRDVLLTLRAEEIAGWARSVQLRGLVMPAGIRDELLMIVSEARYKTVKN